jgi:regulator of sirC expression with transglutaminase-like and TPR domain
VDPTERFTTLVQGPEDVLALDEAAFLIAAHAHPGLDVDAQLARLDALAASCPAPTLGALLRHLFVDEGFGGNVEDYYDAGNSFLDDVLDRRTGLPITLAVLAMEVGRRLGVRLLGVGMPGHFLLRDARDPSVFVDAFARGALLSPADCAQRFHQLQPGAPFDAAYLEPVGARSIVARILANLKGVYLQEGDRSGLAWVLQLRCAVPGVPVQERRQLASVLEARGRFDEAADELERLAMVEPGDDEELAAAEVTRLRARLN